MERKAAVYTNDHLAGYLIQTDEEYTFQYEDEYFNDANKPSISLTIPKSKENIIQNIYSHFSLSY